MIKQVTMLAAQCDHIEVAAEETFRCSQRADYRVVRTNDDLDPLVYVTAGTRNSYYCAEHAPSDVKAFFDGAVSDLPKNTVETKPKRFSTEGMLAYQGKTGCTDVRCRRSFPDKTCMGYHCGNCHEPSSQQGHTVGNPPRFTCQKRA